MLGLVSQAPEIGRRKSYIDKLAESSDRLEVRDLDWAALKRVGLSDDERYILSYFADIESQTIVYLRDLLHTDVALGRETMTFLSIWNYEECFHGLALARVLEECGGAARDVAEVRKKALLSEALLAVGAVGLAKVMGGDFLALYCAWGAVQELSTLRGYERIIATTRNPTLAELCRRIAKQERRHFAWYYNTARERLASSKRTRSLVVFLLPRLWTPVGAGVKPDHEVVAMITKLFPAEVRSRIVAEIDATIAALPGLEGLTLWADWLSRRGA